jgi:hypothetical protein
MKKHLLVITFCMMPFFLLAQKKQDSAIIDYAKIAKQYHNASRVFYWPAVTLAGVGTLSVIIAVHMLLDDEYDYDEAPYDLAAFGGCALLASIPFAIPAYILGKEAMRYKRALPGGGTGLGKNLHKRNMELQARFHMIPTGYSAIPVYSVGLTLPID